MIFEFRIWGLVLLFVLLSFSSFQQKFSLKKNNFYAILVSSYLLEFFYIICFITGGVGIILKMYSIFMVVIFSLYTYYFIQTVILKKYETKELVISKKLSFIRELIFIFDVLFGVILFMVHDVNIGKFIFIIGFVFSIFQLFVITMGRKIIERNRYYILLGFVFIELVLFVFQIEFPKIEIFQSLVIILTFYLYVTLENPSLKEVETLRIEKEYGDKNIFQKQEFLKKLSHEIRIPINTIDGFSQVIENSNDIKEIKEDTKDIRRASLDLIELINGMIDLSLLESSELKIYNESYNVYDTMDDFVEMIPARLKDKDVKFNYTIEKNIPEVLMGDSLRIKQIILNIISNSIKYTDKGSISLDISSVQSKSVCRLIIKVTDTGKGISQDEITKILSMDGDEKGLGIRISYYLVKLMNGKMDIDSHLGEGTVVTISIDQDIVSLKEEKKEKKKKEINIVSFKEKRVMIVDDNKLNLKVASKLLSPYEVDVVSVTSGQECLDLLDQDNHFDLILMDDMMPNMSGVETLDILRKIERVSGFYIPVIALTANAVPGMRTKYLDSGFDDYLSKPIDREELDRIIKEYLK